MDIMVTGGTGFVGLAVCEVLIEAGHTVCMVAHEPPPEIWTSRMSACPGWSSEICDVRDAPALNALTSRLGVDVFVHGAALTPAGSPGLDEAEAVFAVNALGTLHALHAAIIARVPRFFFLSSASVYGDAAFDGSALDEVRTVPLPSSLYALSKFTAERFCHLARGQQSSTSICILRLGSVFGRWEYPSGVRGTLSAVYQVTTQALGGKTVILPRSCRRDWIYSRDVGDALRSLAEADTNPDPLLNVGLGHEWRLEEWCEGLAAIIPGFTWGFESHAETATVELFADRDRAPLAVDRLVRAGFTPSYPMETALTDYVSWAR